MTANIREWKHIFELRCSNHAHPAIRQLLIPVLLYFKQEMPEIYKDISYDEELNKNYYAELRIVDDF